MEKIMAMEDNHPKHLYDMIDPINQHENMDDTHACPPADRSVLPDEENADNHSKVSGPEAFNFKRIIVDSDDEMRRDVRNLSDEQRVVFDSIITYCKEKVMTRKRPVSDLEPPRFIVHGGGGVGKSYLINVVSKWAEFFLRQRGDDPLHPKVLLMAPTGKAATLIGNDSISLFYFVLSFVC